MAPPRIRVLLAVTGQPYEEALLAALAGPGSPLVVSRRCLDIVDLLAAATTRTSPVAVVSADLHRLDRDAVSRLTACGVLTFGVADTGTDADRLMALGLSGVVRADADGSVRSPAAELTALVLRALPTGTAPVDAPVPGLAGPPGPVPADRGQGPAAGRPGGPHGSGRGQLVAVWGPVGAPGRTSVAVTLADEMARLGVQSVLADADTYGPSVAQRLGILDEASGLAAAVRAANAGDLDAQALAAAARTVAGGMRVLTGLTRADRWPELAGSALAAVWRGCKDLADVTVVDCGFCLEEDDELGYDGLVLRRNAATLTTLAQADRVVVVGSADPVGVARLLRGLHEITALARRRPRGAPDLRHVVLTQVRPGPVGRGPGRQLTRLLSHSLDGSAARCDPVLVPDDRPAHDAAVAAGRTLAEVAARSPARTALAGLAAAIAGAPAPFSRRPAASAPT